MKRIIFTICSVFILLLAGCSSKEFNNQEINEINDKETNAVAENYYIGNINYSVHVILFGSDYIVEWVDCGMGRATDKRKKYYGTYEVEGRKLTLTLSGQEEPQNCVIHDNGEKLTIAGFEFERVEPSKLSNETINSFDK